MKSAFDFLIEQCIAIAEKKLNGLHRKKNTDFDKKSEDFILTPKGILIEQKCLWPKSGQWWQYTEKLWIVWKSHFIVWNYHNMRKNETGFTEKFQMLIVTLIKITSSQWRPHFSMHWLGHWDISRMTIELSSTDNQTVCR